MTLHAHIALDPGDPIGTVHDHLYGANLEHIGRSVYRGVWAEMLTLRKFAGHDRPYVGLSEGLDHQHPDFGIVSRHVPDDAPQNQGVGWRALNPAPGVLYVHDNTTAYNPNASKSAARTGKRTACSKRACSWSGERPMRSGSC